MLPTQAFILCGGKGERLRPLTNDTPKPLVKIHGKPIVLQLVEKLTKVGVTKIVFATGFKAEKIRNFFENGKKFGLEISYSHETTPLGTGGALKQAEYLLDKRFFMLNGDNLFDVDFKKMNAVHEKNSALATIALVKVENVSDFGVARLDEEKISEFVEKPKPSDAPSNWINCGAYIIEKTALEFIPSGFNLIEKTLFPTLAQQQKLFAYKHTGQWFPTDTIEKLKKAEKEWKPQNPNKNQNAKVKPYILI